MERQVVGGPQWPVAWHWGQIIYILKGPLLCPQLLWTIRVATTYETVPATYDEIWENWTITRLMFIPPIGVHVVVDVLSPILILIVKYPIPTGQLNGSLSMWRKGLTPGWYRFLTVEFKSEGKSIFQVTHAYTSKLNALMQWMENFAVLDLPVRQSMLCIWHLFRSNNCMQLRASCYNCMRPDSWNDMVQCDSCDQWYHTKSVCVRSLKSSIQQLGM